MRHPTVTVLVLAMLAACGQDDPAPAPPADTPSAPSGVPRAPTPAVPDLAACPKAEDPEVRIRTGPVPVPAPFAAIAVSSMDHFAFTTLAGNTICVDTTWIESADDAEEGFSGDDYWPEEMEPQTFYEPVERGFEREIAKRLDYWNKLRKGRHDD